MVSKKLQTCHSTEQAPAGSSYSPSVLEESSCLIHAMSAATASETTSPFGNATAAETARLRNFLCYLLVADYRPKTAATDISLSAADATHYHRLATTIHEATTALSGLTPSLRNDAQRIELARYAWAHLHAPARALGVPADAVLCMLLRFHCQQGAYGGYKGVCGHVMRHSGFGRLAAKLRLDRLVVVPRVAAAHDPAFAAALLDALDRTQRLYFVSLDGLGASEIRMLDSGDQEEGAEEKGGDGVGLGGWCHGSPAAAAGPGFELTEWAKGYEERRRKCAFDELAVEDDACSAKTAAAPSSARRRRKGPSELERHAAYQAEALTARTHLQTFGDWLRGLVGMPPMPRPPKGEKVSGKEGEHFRATVTNPDFLDDQGRGAYIKDESSMFSPCLD